MAKRNDGYTRLPGKKLLGKHASLWLGEDHILSVNWTWFQEDYRRFYFKDIQAFVTTETNSHARWEFAFLSVLLIVGLLFIAMRLGGGGTSVIGFSVAGVVVLVPLAINRFRGPSCRCYVLTAVSMEELPSISRVKAAVRVMNALRPLVEKAQGTLSREEIAQRAAVPETAVGAPRRPLSSPMPGERRIQSSYSGEYHFALFLTLLGAGLLAVVNIFFNSIAIELVGGLLSLLLMLTAIVALVKQPGSALGKGLKSTTWASLGCAVIMYAVDYVIYMYVMLSMMENHQGAITNQWAMITEISALDPFSHSLLLAAFVFMAVAPLSLGVIGLLLYRDHRGPSSRKGLEAKPGRER